MIFLEDVLILLLYRYFRLYYQEYQQIETLYPTKNYVADLKTNGHFNDPREALLLNTLGFFLF